MKKHILNFALVATIIGTMATGCSSSQQATTGSDSTNVDSSAVDTSRVTDTTKIDTGKMSTDTTKKPTM
jgi:hypothetical protein